MMTTCLMTAEAVVGVMVTTGVVLALPLPGGLLLMPLLQPLRTRDEVRDRARSFRIMKWSLRVAGILGKSIPFLGLRHDGSVKSCLTEGE
jgi:hypothetical protein